MARDPASGVIRWFDVLMFAVFVGSAALAVLALWGGWRFVRHLVGA
jgi:hypothetical protein